MGFFSGPSNDVLLGMARGIASTAMQLRMMNALDPGGRQEMAKSLEASGLPTSLEQLLRSAAVVVKEQNLGWYKRNLFLGMIKGSFVEMGIPEVDAQYYKGNIEIMAR